MDFQVLYIITIITLIVMTLLVYENSRLNPKEKKKYYLTYFFLCCAMMAEWLGILLNEAPVSTINLHRVVKCLDYIFTPMAGFMLVSQVSDENSLYKFVRGLLSVNVVIQILSIFTGWTFYVDAQNIYHHGSFYIIYPVIYLMTMFIVFVEFYLYGKNFEKKNRSSLTAIMLLLLMASILQEIFNYRVSYLLLSIASVFIYIHYEEFKQVSSEELFKLQKKLLDTDPLSGLHSRYAYTDDLKVLEEVDTLAENLIVFSVDINELKMVNDNYGHLAGDELIKGAASCITKVLGGYGKCYRTGGDEFIAFLYIGQSFAHSLKRTLINVADQWEGKLVDRLSLSVGYASVNENPGTPIEKLIGLADEKMYEDKAKYYISQERGPRRISGKSQAAIEAKQKEYIDIISAFVGDVTGLYVVDRDKHEVTAYRLSASDHRIRSGVPLETEFDVAMESFIEKKVHPDDKDTMRQTIQYSFIEEELSRKRSFIYHFRTVIDGRIQYHYMKCIRNYIDDDFDKIIISFCPEDKLVTKDRIQDILKVEESGNVDTLLLAHEKNEDFDILMECLSQNYNVLIAESGNEAEDILKQNYRDISAILYQQEISERNGSEFLAWIQKNVFVSSIPVIMITDAGNVEKEQKYVEMGAIDYIRKPFDSILIRNRIQNILRMRKISDSLGKIEIDDLTGLYTKQAFLYRAKKLLDANPNSQFSIAISDIQNFKMYNAIYGESKGDVLLQTIAKYIQKLVVSGVGARYGADQFVIIAKHITKERVEKEIAGVNKFISEQTDDRVTIKFGVYENVDRSLDVARMCDRALFALRSIKQIYDRSYAFFDDPASQRQYRAHMYEANFKQAMEDEEFVVWYQPKYNPYTEQIVGGEALVRWLTKSGRLIPPSEFLPEFERNGLIVQLDEYVFRTTCAQIKRWKESGQEMIPISVNLSRHSMHQQGIVKRYKDIVEEYNIPSHMVPIEITESAAIDNMEIKPLADAFYQAGFFLHMDDFGSGKSSITGLALLHFDIVKIDKSLIDVIGKEHGNLVLMYTIALAKELGLKVVAEGVETEEQLNYLKEIGCEFVQGYYFSKPLNVKDFEEKLSMNIDIKESDIKEGPVRSVSENMIKQALDRVLQNMPGGFLTYTCDEKETILSSNRYLWNLYGCESEEEFLEYVGGSFKGMVVKEDLERVEEYISKQIQGKEKMDYVEYDILRKDGKRISVVDYGHLENQANGDVFYVFIAEADKV